MILQVITILLLFTVLVQRQIKLSTLKRLENKMSELSRENSQRSGQVGG